MNEKHVTAMSLVRTISWCVAWVLVAFLVWGPDVNSPLVRFAIAIGLIGTAGTGAVLSMALSTLHSVAKGLASADKYEDEPWTGRSVFARFDEDVMPIRCTPHNVEWPCSTCSSAPTKRVYPTDLPHLRNW